MKEFNPYFVNKNWENYLLYEPIEDAKSRKELKDIDVVCIGYIPLSCQRRIVNNYEYLSDYMLFTFHEENCSLRNKVLDLFLEKYTYEDEYMISAGDGESSPVIYHYSNVQIKNDIVIKTCAPNIKFMTAIVWYERLCFEQIDEIQPRADEEPMTFFIQFFDTAPEITEEDKKRETWCGEITKEADNIFWTWYNYDKKLHQILPYIVLCLKKQPKKRKKCKQGRKKKKKTKKQKKML